MKPTTQHNKMNIGLGVALGIALGVASNSVALGVAVGLIFALGLRQSDATSDDKKKPLDQA